VVIVRYFAGARAAARTAEEKVDAATLSELLSQLGDAHGSPLARVLTSASYLVDGVAWHDRSAPFPADAVIDVLPPFAGG
jgi:molybdopterin synthase sulfur carrier subunit